MKVCKIACAILIFVFLSTVSLRAQKYYVPGYLIKNTATGEVQFFDPTGGKTLPSGWFRLTSASGTVAVAQGTGFASNTTGVGLPGQLWLRSPHLGYITTSSLSDTLLIGLQANHALVTGDAKLYLPAGSTISLGGLLIGSQQDYATKKIIRIGNKSKKTKTEETGYKNILIGDLVQIESTTGKENVVIGHEAGVDITTGYNNVVVGFQAANTLTTGGNNTVVGYKAAQNLTTGADNVLLGEYAGRGVKATRHNTIVGYNAGPNKDSEKNVYLGFAAGYSVNSTVGQNTMIGSGIYGKSSDEKTLRIGAGEQTYIHGNKEGNIGLGVDADTESLNKLKLPTGKKINLGGMLIGSQQDYGSKGIIRIGNKSNKTKAEETGEHNIAIGYGVLANNTGAHGNTMIGYQAGEENTDKGRNTYVGYQSGQKNVSGEKNTYIGYNAGQTTTGGKENVFLGYYTGANEVLKSYNTLIGTFAGHSSSGAHNTVLGYEAGTKLAGDKNVIVGSGSGNLITNKGENTIIGSGISGLSTDEKTLRIGAGQQTYIHGNKDGNIGLGVDADTESLNKLTLPTGKKINLGGLLIGSQQDYGSKKIIRIGNKSKKTKSQETGVENIAIGDDVLTQSTKGSGNTAVGDEAARDNTEGKYNSVLGYEAGRENETGNFNTYIGYAAGRDNTTGSSNTNIGSDAGIFLQGAANVM